MAMTEVLFEKQPKKKKWWKTNRGLIIILLVLICVVLGGYNYYLRFGSDTGNLCTTKECLKASVRIISSIDNSVDPCDDFYRFSCGDFIKEAHDTNIPFPQLAQKLRRDNQVNGIIASPITGEEWTSLLLQKSYYQSCMNVSAIDEDENQTLMRLLDELGGWPIIKGQDWVFEDFELDRILVKCKEMGLPFEWFFTISLVEQTNHIKIRNPSIDTQFTEPYKESVYLDLMVETAVALGGSRTIAKIELEKVLDFERHLSQILNNSDLYELTQTYFNDLDVKFSNNDLSSLIEELVQDVFLFTDNTTIRINENVMNELNLLLAGTARRTCANYFIWKIIQEFGVFLATPLRENFGNFSSFMTNNRVMTRSDICLQEAKKRFPNIAEASYVSKHVDGETVQSVKEMISNIQDKLIARISVADWISNSSKGMAIEKIKNVITIVGDQRLEFNSDFLDNLLDLGNVNVTTGNIIDMMREININDFRMKFMLNFTSTDKLKQFIFQMTTEVNAGYMDQTNIIVISAAIMQDLYFSVHRPNYLNYGNLGTIIGHELAHGYDEDASAQDREGREIFIESLYNGSANEGSFRSAINPIRLWDNESLTEISARSTCLDNQYTEFLSGKSTKDSNILGENFADLLGVDFAYEAYFTWWKIHGNEEKALPGLSYNPQQMFWIQFATNFCYEKGSSYEYNIQNDWHASFNYRVLASVKNSRYFPLDFKCMPGTNMNPVEKCFIF